MSTESPAPVLASGISSWLQAEIQTSDAPNSPNRYLSSYKEQISRWHEQLGLGVNFFLEKKMAHAGRFLPHSAGFMGAFLDSPQDEEAYARLLFAGLMRLSGESRELAVVSAHDQQTYETYRSLYCSPAKLAQDIRRQNDSGKHITPEGIEMSARLNIIDRILPSIDFIINRVQKPKELGNKDSPLANHIQGLREGVISFCLDLTDYGIQTFGALEKVPTLEPFSISDDPEIILPFDPTTWASYTPSNPKYSE